MSASNTPSGHKERHQLPNYLLSPSPAPNSTPFKPVSPASSLIANQRPKVTFNDRLREDRDPYEPPTVAPEVHTPSTRKPPNRSMLDVGAPSIHSLRSPSASPATHHTPSTTTGGHYGNSTPAPQQPAGTDRWVTIFGFPSSVESQAVREFRRHGEIVRVVPGRGNWTHLLYRTPMQAQVALFRQWRLLGGTDVMVGSVPCTEPSLAKENDEAVEKGFLVASPGARNGASPFTLDTSAMRAGAPSPGLRTPSSILRRDPGSAAQSIIRTPQRQTGLFDYFTGFYR